MVTSPSIPISKMKRQLHRHREGISLPHSHKDSGFPSSRRGPASNPPCSLLENGTPGGPRREGDGRNEEMCECTVRLRADGWVKVLQRLLCGSGGTDRCGVPLRSCNLQWRRNEPGNQKRRRSKRVKAPEAELGLGKSSPCASCRSQATVSSAHASARLRPVAPSTAQHSDYLERLSHSRSTGIFRRG